MPCTRMCLYRRSIPNLSPRSPLATRQEKFLANPQSRWETLTTAHEGLLI